MMIMLLKEKIDEGKRSIELKRNEKDHGMRPLAERSKRTIEE